MPDYSRNEIVDILLSLGACQGRYRAAARYYRHNYPGRLHYPNHVRIRSIEQRERHRPPIRRNRRRIMLPNNDDPRILVVLAMVDLDPHISLRNIHRRTGIPRSTTSRILRLHRFHPYHITLTQALMPNDFRRRLNFCIWAQARIRKDPEFLRYVMFSDEATFHGNGQLNRHNSHYWSVYNPNWVRHFDNQHRWSLVVWCGIVNGYLIGPYFFDGNVNGAAYLNFLQNELPELLTNIDLETRRRLWLQQDGAPCHRSLMVRRFLNERYRGRWIGIGSNIVTLLSGVQDH